MEIENNPYGDQERLARMVRDEADGVTTFFEEGELDGHPASKVAVEEESNDYVIDVRVPVGEHEGYGYVSLIHGLTRSGYSLMGLTSGKQAARFIKRLNIDDL